MDNGLGPSGCGAGGELCDRACAVEHKHRPAVMRLGRPKQKRSCHPTSCTQTFRGRSLASGLDADREFWTVVNAAVFLAEYHRRCSSPRPPPVAAGASTTSCPPSCSWPRPPPATSTAPPCSSTAARQRPGRVAPGSHAPGAARRWRCRRLPRPRQARRPGPRAGNGGLCVSESLWTNADDCLPAASLGRIEGG